jgi:release factor glutamine methyltransferase
MAKPLAAPQILDIGSGSGNIVIALAKHLLSARLTAIDISAEALAVAQRNAAKHGVSDRVRFLQGDLFSPLGAETRFDLIVSNPPYIAEEDLPKLEVGVRQYEPQLALNGGPGGYRVVERLVCEADAHLAEGGWLMLEIGAPQEAEVRRIIKSQSGYQLLPTIRDYSGHPRVLQAQRKAGG